MSELKKELGKTYYDILDINHQNIVSQLLERSADLKINSDLIQEISLIVQNEGIKAKDWGWNIINKKIDENLLTKKKDLKTKKTKSK